jgi:hypothetical protein
MFEEESSAIVEVLFSECYVGLESKRLEGLA